MKKNKIDIKNITNASELLDAKYGQIGTKTRNEFQEEAHRFYISEMLKSARKEANLTQSELAEKIGTKKSYISKIENQKGNITIETLIKIFESGLQKRVGISIT
jgi:DNA-binding XRE family transcriptional regulator